MSQVTKYVRSAMRLYLADPATGFNAQMVGAATSYGIQPLSIDWTAPPASKQYFEAFMTPDDIDESTPSKYPMVFAHGIDSNNTHDALPRTFSGQVNLGLAFWVTVKFTNASKAAAQLENTLDCIEDIINSMFTNGNWPQSWGATNAVCTNIPATRGRIETGGEEWRQLISFRLAFMVDN